jgi:hypothetical protein
VLDPGAVAYLAFGFVLGVIVGYHMARSRR